MYANVIVNVTSSNVDVSFDYLVPDEISSLIKVGTRVKVPFGQGNRTVMGYVVSLSDSTNYSGEMKEIIELVDLIPVISEKKIQLAKYIKEDTHCPLIRILNIIVPEILQLKPVKYLKVNDINKLDARLAEVFGQKEVIEYNKSLSKYSYIIYESIQKQILSVRYDALSIDPIKYEYKYKLNESKYYQNVDNLKDLKIRYLESILNEEPLSKDDLIDRTMLSTYKIDKYIKEGILLKEKVRASRIKVREIPVTDRYIKEHPLYNKVVSIIQSSKDTKPVLWIPSSIDEENAVIERVIRDNIQNKLNTLIVCPDILTSFKFSTLIRKKVKVSVACLNSLLGKGEYFDFSEEIKNGEYRVVVTTPKGSLLEYPNIGTIIMVDGENENYFNDQSPRYDLKKVMYAYSKMYNTNFVVASYSPNLDDYVNGIKGSYNTIDNRDLITDNINCEVVNLKEELLKGNNSLLSERLVRKIKLNKAKGFQTLIISNRKQHSNYVMCRSCGEISKCPKCDVALKYSQKNDQLMCPACSYKIPMIKKCPSCGSDAFRYEGSGIEQLVNDLSEVLPEYNVRTIIDSSYDEFSDAMNELEEKKVDIVISTNVYSHSIIDNNIGLICILNLEEVIGSSSFYANERTYNMLSYAKVKILGKENTEMLIQTYNPNNFVLNTFITNNYKEYIKTEINNRKSLKNTPFYDINRILVKGKYDEVFKEANRIKKLIQDLSKGSAFIIGPTYNKIYQSVQIIVKHQLNNIDEIYKKLYEHYQSSQLSVIIDKYPRYL